MLLKWAGGKKEKRRKGRREKKKLLWWWWCVGNYRLGERRLHQREKAAAHQWPTHSRKRFLELRRKRRRLKKTGWEGKSMNEKRAGVYLSGMIFSNEMACDGERKRCCWQRCWRRMNWYRSNATEYPTANANSIGNRATEQAESHSKKEKKGKEEKGKGKGRKKQKEKGKKTREREKLSKYEATSVPTTNRIRR